MFKKIAFNGFVIASFIVAAFLFTGIARAQSDDSDQNQIGQTAAGSDYLITLFHKAESCKVAHDDFIKDANSAGITSLDNANARWACSDNNRVTYLIVTASSEDDARAMVPKSWQHGMTVVQLSQFQAPGTSDQTGTAPDQTPGQIGTPRGNTGTVPDTTMAPTYPQPDTTGVNPNPQYPDTTGINPRPQAPDTTGTYQGGNQVY